MRIVLVGARGRLGAALASAYRDAFDIIPFDRRALDLADPASVERALEPLAFDAVINCAALTNVDHCETHPDEAHAINTRAVADLARKCRAKNARLIHISTDYVFDGESSKPYAEDDMPKPISVYGASKLAGEHEALSGDEKNMVVRVSWVFGPDRPSFIDGILRRAMTSDTVDAIGDKFSTPAYTVDLAVAIQALMTRSAQGVVHACNRGECSWRDYGVFALECARKIGLPVRTTEVEATKLSDMKSFVARRPVYSVLSTNKLARLIGDTPRPWQEAVEEYVTRFGRALVPESL